MVKIPVLNNCCFCFTLPTGGLVMGWVGAVFSFLGVVLSITALANISSFTKEVNEKDLAGAKVG